MKSISVARDIDVEVLLEIIKHYDDYKENSKNGLVILLNGAWGSGKSTFLSQLEDKINEDEEVDLFLNYNAYEYDFYDTPYIPFFASIEDKIELGDDLNCLVKITSNFGHTLLFTIYAILNGFYKKNFDIELNDIKDNFLGLENENYKQDFENFKLFKKNIESKVKEVSSNKLQLFVVDELDRCKPNFAIDTLEIVKHFFDIDNCVFIISVDKLQLEESVKTIFGQNMDSEKYFSKFFDYQYNLLPIKFYETVDTSNIRAFDSMIKDISELFHTLNISLRDSNKIFNEFIMKYNKYCVDGNNWSKQQCLFIIFLLTLKYTDLLFYTEFINGNYKRYISKVKDERTVSSNNYNKLLMYKIDEKNTYSSLLSIISEYLDLEYLELKSIFTTFTSFDTEHDRIFRHKQEVGKSLYNYIPQVISGGTYKDNIETIIN